ncbi:chemotaxis protein CheW [Herbaspirillum sp. SJZ107]|uniref:chemotaxis protein CheW n=1 Tax=Herbaspirillum sp. SJZ107 TaxID=2572881 RepID=UPI00115390CB|nr:chemotaxis protein CheW [Herbaspirillum sp. SJZ107]TQK03276.1 purine-binding chemotaxis protein CheW [Herbaspirillum sp. SJZ107]
MRDEINPAPQAADSEVRQFVTFVAGNQVFAVDMAPVQEIIRVPEVVRVPLAPPTLDGLANLRGKVLPIISLRRIFGYPERPADDASRAVVIDLGQPLGFVVDRVASVVGVDVRQIEDAAGVSTTVRSELLRGLLKDVGGHAMIMVLDFERLIAAEFAQAARAVRSAAVAGLNAGAAAGADDGAAADELQLVSFEVAGQEYAVAIENVQEIVQMPDEIVEVPHAEGHVLGVMTLRQRLLPLVSLRRMFALPERAADEQSRIVVVAIGGAGVGAAVGVVMDSVNEVLRVPLSGAEPVPPLLAREPGMADIARICRLDGGKRLVSIIDAASMFRQDAIREVLENQHMQTHMEEDTGNGRAGSDDEEQLVVFRLGQEEFGVPIDSVQEIVRVPEQLTQVPRAPAFVEGVINLRGAVLPVVDLRRRLGLLHAERSDRQRIMVFVIDGVRTGFIVDSVAEVLKVERRAIEPAPCLSAEQSRLLARMANLEKQKRMIQLLDPRHLIAEGDLAQLAGIEV